MSVRVSRYARNSSRINRVIVSQMTLAAAIAIRIAAPESVPREVLARASGLAARIFERAGVRVVWGAPGDLELQILPGTPPNITGDGLGFAILQPTGTGYAAVSYPRVVAAAGQCEQDHSVVLGAAMAHEIGHLLLGAKSHAAGTVMSPRLGCPELRRAARSELWFSPGEAGRMRTEVLRRR
jgi:hypothetical protein